MAAAKPTSYNCSKSMNLNKKQAYISHQLDISLQDLIFIVKNPHNSKFEVNECGASVTSERGQGIQYSLISMQCIQKCVGFANKCSYKL